jgi:tetratricopeptide (TPR) repeat protein
MPGEMIMSFRMKRSLLSLGCIFALFTFLPPLPSVLAQPPTLEDGIKQYKNENYEEAIEILKQVRKADPSSSTAAFFLGLAYKQAPDYPNAFANLKDAVTLQPRIKEALVELIDVAIILDRTDEAKKWIGVAEKEGIFPAKVAFLKGLLLKKENKNMEAVESFKRSMQLDATLTQSAEFQIALCHLQQKELKKAREQFQAAVLHGPDSDLASFARRYQDMVDKRIFQERPWRFTLGAFGFYDTNPVLDPEGGPGIPSLGDKESFGLATNARVDWVPKIEGPWLFNAQYYFRGNFYENFSKTHNLITNGIYLTPGYDFGQQALNLVGSYEFSLVGTDLHRYNSNANIGPLYRRILHPRHVLELYGGYNKQKYYQTPASLPEDRNGDGFRGYVSWFWTYMNGGLFNLRYDHLEDNTDGSNWDASANQFSGNLTYPLRQDLSLQLSGLVLWQDYDNINTATLIPVFGPPRAREDTFYQGSIALSWQFIKNMNLVAQFIAIKSDSNIIFYDYDRQIALLGLEYRF